LLILLGEFVFSDAKKQVFLNNEGYWRSLIIEFLADCGIEPVIYIHAFYPTKRKHFSARRIRYADNLAIQAYTLFLAYF